MTVKILSGFTFSKYFKFCGIKILWEGNTTQNKSCMNIAAAGDIGVSQTHLVSDTYIFDLYNCALIILIDLAPVSQSFLTLRFSLT